MDNNKNTWADGTPKAEQLVVCAAIRHSSGQLICSARHYDALMREQINARGGRDFWIGSEQGFINQFCEFLTREEAWEIAKQMGQIRRNVSCEGTLYSENLY